MLGDIFQILVVPIFPVNPIAPIFSIELVELVDPIEFVKLVGPASLEILFLVTKLKLLVRLALNEICILVSSGFFCFMSLIISK